MISKELWSTVTGKPTPSHLKLFGKTDVTAVVGDNMLSINIHELAHKCKEWARTQHIKSTLAPNLLSSSGDKFHNASCFCDQISLGMPSMRRATEPEAIFAACEWILNQQKEQDE